MTGKMENQWAGARNYVLTLMAAVACVGAAFADGGKIPRHTWGFGNTYLSAYNADKNPPWITSDSILNGCAIAVPIIAKGWVSNGLYAVSPAGVNGYVFDTGGCRGLSPTGWESFTGVVFAKLRSPICPRSTVDVEGGECACADGHSWSQAADRGVGACVSIADVDRRNASAPNVPGRCYGNPIQPTSGSKSQVVNLIDNLTGFAVFTKYHSSRAPIDGSSNAPPRQEICRSSVVWVAYGGAAPIARFM